MRKGIGSACRPLLSMSRHARRLTSHTSSEEIPLRSNRNCSTVANKAPHNTARANDLTFANPILLFGVKRAAAKT
jgi:hypothetical protein